MPRGGKRPGAGRKPKDRSKQDFFETAEKYLEAVVQGKTSPDAVRVSAARALIRYQEPHKRAPIKSPPPRALQWKESKNTESAVIEDFEQKAAEIRARHARKGTK
nr:MAG: hypothetical protein C4576_19710 [Desulfobacteraceae bacterium]